MDDVERADLVAAVAANPEAGEIMQGTGGLRKVRYARPGAGKSGGYRVCTYYHSEDFPVFLVTAFGKNQKANLSKTERNMVAKFLSNLIAIYAKEKD
jgi:hypothetical protein